MDLIFWRHADAQDVPAHDPGDPLKQDLGSEDLARCLTAKGHKQAARMGAWLDRHLTDQARILVSPAMRCEQTAVHLGRKYKVCPELAPWAGVDDLLGLVHWPDNKLPVVVLGHQPTLGQTVNRLLGFGGIDTSFRKGAIWWLRSREREGKMQTLVVTVQSPDFV